jgi:hypothetical protein
VAKAPLEIRSLARKYTHKALNTLVSIMVEPKAPAAARIMAANSLIDRGWGKAAQLVDVAGEIRQLVEVKLNVVHSAPARDIDATCEPVALEYKNNSDDQQILNMLVDRATRAILSNSSGGFGSFLGPGAGEVLAGARRLVSSRRPELKIPDTSQQSHRR